MRTALLGLAAAAIVSAASFPPGPAKAITLGSPMGLKPAADALNPIDKVRYCEFYDPEIDEWVVFWVPGPCLRYGAPGFDVWLGRYYYGHRHWRGRLSSRPWVHGRAVFTGRGSTGRRGSIRTDSGRVHRGGGTRGTVVGPRGGSVRTDSGRGGGQVFRGGGGRTMGGGSTQFRTGGGGGMRSGGGGGMRTGGGGGMRSGGGGGMRSGGGGGGRSGGGGGGGRGGGSDSRR